MARLTCPVSAVHEVVYARVVLTAFWIIVEPLWDTGRPDLTYSIDVFAPSTKGAGGYSMNLLQTHVSTAPTVSGRPVGSYSWAGLCNTFYFVDPINDVGAIISTQVLPFADPQLMKMKDEWESLVYSQVKA